MAGEGRAVRKWLSAASVVVLLLGLGTAILVYQRAEEKSPAAIGYERGEDESYPLEPGDSKKYLRDLEIYGGKFNVLATQFRQWVAGVRRGKSLAYMIALFSVLASYGLFRAGHRDPGPGGSAPKDSAADD